MTTITIALNDDHLAKFQEPAKLLGISPEEMARISLEKFLAQPDEEFDEIIESVIQENAELLRRLAR